jgi:2-oxoglutarate ferredoxin oxidoreductase subunit alpha
MSPNRFLNSEAVLLSGCIHLCNPEIQDKMLSCKLVSVAIKCFVKDILQREAIMECNLLIGGEAGQGLASIENELTTLLFRLNYCYFATKNYMSRIRGGHNFHMFRISDQPVHALSGKAWDMIIALDEETETRHKPTLKKGGIFLAGQQILEIDKTARDTFLNPVASNIIITGIILSMIGVKQEAIGKIIESSHHMDQIRTGFSFADRWHLANRVSMNPRAVNRHRFDGNQSLAFGAILGGCQFMAGYPMTPSTSIMIYFTNAAMELPIHFEQAEDEISAINTALGASYAGLRAMVATSGGGFALMTEAVSLAGMTETSIVIIEAQRPGPSTGLPTRTEQGDLNFVLHAGHGDFPRAVFAPGSIDEAVTLAKKSFELADQYQIPVIILTDQYFADSIQIIEEQIPTDVSHREYLTLKAPYKRYQLTPDGISPLMYPGLSDALVRADSDEHTEEGKITEDLDLRIQMVEKRLKKGDLLRRDARIPSFFGDRDADVMLICWGSNKLIVKEAVEKILAGGRMIGALHFSQLYPLTEEMTAGYTLSRKRLIGIENNATGQFAKHLKRELDIKITDLILKYNGECFTVEELCRLIKEKIV